MAVFPFPQLAELREKYTYNITPFPTSVKSNGRFVVDWENVLSVLFLDPHIACFYPSCHECLLWTGLYSASFSGDDNNAALLFQWWSGQLGERRWCGNGRWGLCGDGAWLPGSPRRPPGPRAAEIPKTSQGSVQPHELRHRIFTGSQWGVYRGSSQN